MMTQETEFLKAQQQFQRLCDLMRQAGREGWRMDEIERKAMPELVRLGLEFLVGHVENQGQRRRGSTVTDDERTLHRSDELHTRRYLSIFGEVSIPRYSLCDAQGQKAEYVPLDARLGLPAGEISYVLEEWQERLCVKTAFGQSVEDLKAILGHGVSVRTAEDMNRNMAEYADAYHIAQPLPPSEEEAELLVVTADGKGVVMRRPMAEELREATEATAAAGLEPLTDPRPAKAAHTSGDQACPQNAATTGGAGDAETSSASAFCGVGTGPRKEAARQETNGLCGRGLYHRAFPAYHGGCTKRNGTPRVPKATPATPTQTRLGRDDADHGRGTMQRSRNALLRTGGGVSTT